MVFVNVLTDRELRIGRFADESLLRPEPERGAVRRHALAGRGFSDTRLGRGQIGLGRFRFCQKPGRAQAQRNPAGALLRLRPPLQW